MVPLFTFLSFLCWLIWLFNLWLKMKSEKESATEMNAAYQTYCPQMRTFALNDRYTKYLLQRVRFVMKFTSTLSRHYKGSHYGQPTKLSVVSSATFCNGTCCQIREEKVERSQWKPRMDKNLYVVEVVEVDTSRKCLKIHFVGFSKKYDDWLDYDTKAALSNSWCPW